jgi:hypothetical protein
VTCGFSCHSPSWAVSGPSAPSGSNGLSMARRVRSSLGVGPERESRVGVPEVGSQRLDALAAVQQGRGVEVAEGMHSHVPCRDEAGRPERRMPREFIEPAPVDRVSPGRVDNQQMRPEVRTERVLPGQGHRHGGMLDQVAVIAAATEPGSGTRRSSSFLGNPNTSRDRTGDRPDRTSVGELGAVVRVGLP